MAGTIATPLAPRRSGRRRALATLVVAGAAANTFLGATNRWGLRRAVAAATATALGTAVVEHVGSRTGRPFGRYSYTGRLRPTFGRRDSGVPVLVPLAWWAMALPAREAAHAALGGGGRAIPRVALGAVALTAWDLFLDPQMTAEDYWRWEHAGRYRGIPLSNFVGWLVVSAGVMAALERLLPPRRADSALVAQYAVTGVMETVGFLCFFRDRLVAAVGAAGMLPIAAAAGRAIVVGRG
jgi:putative membrane protein